LKQPTLTTGWGHILAAHFKFTQLWLKLMSDDELKEQETKVSNN